MFSYFFSISNHTLRWRDDLKQNYKCLFMAAAQSRQMCFVRCCISSKQKQIAAYGCYNWIGDDIVNFLCSCCKSRVTNDNHKRHLIESAGIHNIGYHLAWMECSKEELSLPVDKRQWLHTTTTFSIYSTYYTYFYSISILSSIKLNFYAKFCKLSYLWYSY